MGLSVGGRSAVLGQPLVQAVVWRLRREQERLRQTILLSLFGSTSSLRYLADGLASRSLARLARPGCRRARLALGQELRQNGFVRLSHPLKASALTALRDEFRASIEDPAAFKDFVRRAPDGTDYVARRNVKAPWRRLPSLARLIDEKLEAELADYFGCNFYVAMVEAYRTYGVPESVKSAFGKFMIWHVDTQQAIDVVKLFIPLDDIADDQGPTDVLDKASSRRLSRSLARRLDHVDNAEIERSIDALGRRVAMTASAGDGYLIETQYCFHRAGIPEAERTRDLLVIRLRPWSRFVAAGALDKGRVGRLARG